MTLRHNRFLNVHAINQIIARVETVVRGYNNGVEDLPQLRTVIAQIRRIRRFLPRTQYGQLMRGLRLLSSQLTSRSLPGRYRLIQELSTSCYRKSSNKGGALI